MINTFENTVGLTVRTAGKLKTFQNNNNWRTWISQCTASYNNKIISHQTPFLPSAITISSVKIYQLSGDFFLAKTYAEFITYRDAGTALSLNYTKSTFNNGNIIYINLICLFFKRSNNIYFMIKR